MNDFNPKQMITALLLSQDLSQNITIIFSPSNLKLVNKIIIMKERNPIKPRNLGASKSPAIQPKSAYLPLFHTATHPSPTKFKHTRTTFFPAEKDCQSNLY